GGERHAERDREKARDGEKGAELHWRVSPVDVETGGAPTTLFGPSHGTRALGGGVRLPPLAHRAENGAERSPPRREEVFGTWGVIGVESALDHPALLELLEPS